MTLEKWHKYTDVPIFIASVIFLLAYSWQILEETYRPVCALVINIIWILYGIDYVVSLYLAPNRALWFRNNLLVLFSLVLPLFKPLRLLRLVTMLHMFNRSAGTTIRGRITVYTISAVLLVVYVGALAEYQVEHNAPGATITSFPLSLWWAFVTVTTVGYGDVYPVTWVGRVVAVVLMLTGIALIGIVSAMIGSWLIDQVNRESRAAARAVPATEINEDVEVNDEGGAPVTVSQTADAQTIQNSNGSFNSAEARLIRAEMLRLADSVSKLNIELARTRRLTKKYKHPSSNSVVNSHQADENTQVIAPKPPKSATHQQPGASSAHPSSRRYEPHKAPTRSVTGKATPKTAPKTQEPPQEP